MSSSAEFQVPLYVDETTGVDRVQDILLGGVPIPRGALTGGGFFKLKSADGRLHVVEGSPAAYWPDGSTKWLHLCGLVDLFGGERNEFTLTGDAVRQPESLKAGDAMSVNAGGHTLLVSGGELEVEVNSDAQNVLVVRRAGQSRLIMPGLTARLALAGPNGENRRDLEMTFEDRKPEVVVATANRIVVRLAGRFVQPGGQTAGELILFIEVLRQAAELRLQPVFIYLGRPERDLVEELTLTVRTPICGQDVEYGLANERGQGFWDVIQRIKDDPRGGDGPRWPQARLVQSGSSFYVIEKRTGDDASWTKCGAGRRSVGWCHFKGGGMGVTAAMRYFWQEYPRSLAIDADRGTITFGLVPPEAPALDLRRYSTQIYGAPVYEASKGPFPMTHGATGIAKSSELMLRFDTNGREDAPERALFFVRPARPMVPPEYFAQTKVLGHVAPARPDKHVASEALMQELADFLVRERDIRGWYGLMNFGDIMCAYYSDLDRWAFDDGGYAWINTESLPDYGLWLQALRNARSDWLEAAVEMTRHNRDVDMYHRGSLKGLGTRHNVNHWGCQDKEWRVSMPLVKRLHYYLTADPWTREVIRETVKVYQQYERTKGIAPGQTAVFAGILVRWEMDHNPTDERTLSNFARAIAAAVRQDGMFTRDLHVNLATGEGHPVGEEPFTAHFFMNVFGGQHAIVEYAELVGDKQLSEAILRHLRYYMADDKKLPEGVDHRHRGAGSVMVFLAHAYRQTGDEKYRQAIADSLENRWIRFEQIGGDGILDEPPHKCLSGMKRRNKVACGLGDVLHQAAYGLDVM